MASCAASEPHTAGTHPAASSDGSDNKSATTRPFLIREAGLPKGFPAPSRAGTIVLKDYPACRLARVRSAEGTGANSMFRPLFNHIERNGIPMTAPVEIGYAATDAADTGASEASPTKARAVSMAFLYGDRETGNPGRDPADSRVVVEDVPALTVLSIGLRGNYTDDNFRTAIERLHTWISETPGRVRVVGPPRYLAYNSPFVPGFLKFGEVQLPVERITDARTGQE